MLNIEDEGIKGRLKSDAGNSSQPGGLSTEGPADSQGGWESLIGVGG